MCTLLCMTTGSISDHTYLNVSKIFLSSSIYTNSRSFINTLKFASDKAKNTTDWNDFVWFTLQIQIAQIIPRLRKLMRLFLIFCSLLSNAIIEETNSIFSYLLVSSKITLLILWNTNAEEKKNCFFL